MTDPTNKHTQFEAIREAARTAQQQDERIDIVAPGDPVAEAEAYDAALDAAFLIVSLIADAEAAGLMEEIADALRVEVAGRP